MKRILDLAHLHAADEVGQRLSGRRRHQPDLTGDRITVIRRDGDALKRDEHFDPFGRPGPITICRKIEERAECKCSPLPILIVADLIVIAAGSKRQGEERVALVEGENLGELVPAELRGDQSQKCRFARARRSKNQGVADIIDM